MAVSNPDRVVTKQDLADFYGAILPYLGGSAHTGFTPIGTIIAVMGKTAPTNYLACNGQVVNITDYPELATYFNTQFESSNFFGGDGVTTFAVPDLRGEFLRGTGTNSHANEGDGAGVGVHQSATRIPRISTGTSTSVYGSDIAVAFADKNIGTSVKNRYSSSSSGSASDTPLYTSRPTNTSVLYCIAIKNIFMDAGSNYSTEEQIIGTWTDGKLLYQKTIDCGALTDNAGTYVSISSLNCETIVSLLGFAKNSSNGNIINIPYCDRLKTSVVDIYFSKSTDTINLETNFNATTFNAYVTLKYTKTTD